MNDSYLNYRVKGIWFFIGIPILVVALGIIAGLEVILAVFLLPVIAVLITGTIFWVSWQVMSVFWYMVKQICQAISDKAPIKEWKEDIRQTAS
jgi:divalent metal cation (Fe/Co/Zn/Cd) transporter